MVDASATGSWMVGVRRNPAARLRLICVPYAGGGASIFRRWEHELRPSIEACSVQLPGRENRLAEAPYSRCEPLVGALADAVAPALDRPFALFGCSMGALLVFELARELRRRRLRQPEKLLVAAHPAPHLLAGRRRIHDLPDARFIHAIRRLQGTPDEVLDHGELRALMLPLLRADFAVCETYVHRPDAPLECPITAFGGRQDWEVNRRELEAWREHTRAEFALHVLPGGHFVIQTAPASLLRHVRDELTPYARLPRESERATW